jgi:UDP-3-O-acyl N-acetylglucosamine deacetylase
MPRTLASPTAEIAGRGLFSGKPASVRIFPAAPGSGIAFRRMDLPGEPTIPADLRALAPSTPARNTNLAISPTAIVMTVEHVLSALAAHAVSDGLIELRGPEVPIGDGSAAMFAQALRFAGFTDAAGPAAAPIRLHQDIVVESGAARIVARPRSAPGASYTYELDYSPAAPIAAQTASWHGDPKDYTANIAPARTFCLQAEAEQMRAAGLFKDFSPRDLLVIGPTGPIDNAYRFDHEPARHKLLDLIGDLALTGRRIQADITAMRAGHALNHAMAKALAAASEQQAA